MQPAKRDPYWTKARVIDGLRRFYRRFGVAPSSSNTVNQMAKEFWNGKHRAFPPKGQIFRYFPTMYDAWKATGIEETLPHCECGALLPSFDSRCCPECGSKHLSSGLRAGWATKRKHVFTEEIDAEIRRTYTEVRRSSKVARIKALADRTDMPKWRICKRARELGLLDGRVKEPAWTPEELATLEKFSYMNEQRIQMRLKEKGYARSALAIHIKLARLKLRKEAPYYTANRLSVLLGEDIHAILKWIAEGLIPVTLKGTTRHGKQGGDIKLIHEVDAYIFLTTHRQLCDLRKVNQDWYLGMMLDFPIANLGAIAGRILELKTSAVAVKWEGSRWRERKGFKRPDRRAQAAA
jgi:hypothetical protein